MSISILLFFLIAVFVVIILIANIPIYIAKARNIREEDLQMVKNLSWLSLLIGVTWFVALILALFYPSQNQASGNKEKKDINLNALEKLYQLKEQGILTQQEYDREKRKIMGTLS